MTLRRHRNRELRTGLDPERRRLEPQDREGSRVKGAFGNEDGVKSPGLQRSSDIQTETHNIHGTAQTTARGIRFRQIEEFEMNWTSRKYALSAVAALALAAAAPGAQAQHPGHGPGGGPGHGPGGGPGGGWHGGGPHPGGPHPGGPHPGGWQGQRGHGHRGHGGDWVGPAVAGAIGGLALGALAGSAAAPYYGYGPGYSGGCYWQRRPAYDPWGRFVGYAPVQVCY
jgi:hypothetical protein